jgi:uracil-DNA glycosylase family 4
MTPLRPPSLVTLNRRIVACEACPRLRTYCAAVAVEKRKAYRDDDYWCRPVPNFLCEGDPGLARLLIVGLAPGAHGANRTGRMFTGDRSGDFLYAALHRAGFASQPTSSARGDGLMLYDAVITAAAHCAPPGNKPANDELAHCSGWLDATFAAMPRVRVVLCLGGIALHAVVRRFGLKPAQHRFTHAAEFTLDTITVLCSYHVSQQNTFTGRLTPAMLDDVLRRARQLIAEG